MSLIDKLIRNLELWKSVNPESILCREENTDDYSTLINKELTDREREIVNFYNNTHGFDIERLFREIETMPFC